MPTFATKKDGSSIDPITEGTHLARIYQFIHVGTVAGYQGKQQNKCRISFELPNETHVFKEEEGPKPRVISQSFSLSTSEKSTLRKVIEACIGTALEEEEAAMFDAETLVGKHCLITIKHKAKADGQGKYAVVDGFSPVMKGLTIPPAVNPDKVLNYAENWDKAFFEALPDFLKDEMKLSPEYEQMLKNNGEVNPDEIPF